jgi:hypothetical protein
MSSATRTSSSGIDGNRKITPPMWPPVYAGELVPYWGTSGEVLKTYDSESEGLGVKGRYVNILTHVASAYSTATSLERRLKRLPIFGIRSVANSSYSLSGGLLVWERYVRIVSFM